MSHNRLRVYAAAALVPPALALAWGYKSLVTRDHPAPPPRLDAAELAKMPRPAIDPQKPTVVVLLGADLTEITDALAPYEIFARAGRFNVVTASVVRQPTLLTGGLRVVPHYALPELDSLIRSPAIVVVPNLPKADNASNRPIVDWIRRQAGGGALIHSWCKGAMALAETGLLDGRTATAHWGDIAKLEKRYPAVTWRRGVRWIDDGQFVMSAGITSGIDASLRVLIRVAGDSVARRVAREMRYPDFAFALEPAVEQYTIHITDLVLVANAAFRLFRPIIGVGLYAGIGETDLSNIYDAHVHTMIATAEAIATSHAPVVTAHGLTLLPSMTTEPGGELRPSGIERVVIPGDSAQALAGDLRGRVADALPGVPIDFIHATQPARFGLEPVLEDLNRTSDFLTARFAQRRMEYRSRGVTLSGSPIPWVPLVTALELVAAGVMAVWALTHPSLGQRRSRAVRRLAPMLRK